MKPLALKRGNTSWSDKDGLEVEARTKVKAKAKAKVKVEVEVEVEVEVKVEVEVEVENAPQITKIYTDIFNDILIRC